MVLSTSSSLTGHPVLVAGVFEANIKNISEEAWYSSIPVVSRVYVLFNLSSITSPSPSHPHFKANPPPSKIWILRYRQPVYYSNFTREHPPPIVLSHLNPYCKSAPWNHHRNHIVLDTFCIPPWECSHQCCPNLKPQIWPRSGAPYNLEQTSYASFHIYL